MLDILVTANQIDDAMQRTQVRLSGSWGAGYYFIYDVAVQRFI